MNVVLNLALAKHQVLHPAIIQLVAMDVSVQLATDIEQVLQQNVKVSSYANDLLL